MLLFQGKTTHLFGGVSELEKGTTLLGGLVSYLSKNYLALLEFHSRTELTEDSSGALGDWGRAGAQDPQICKVRLSLGCPWDTEHDRLVRAEAKAFRPPISQVGLGYFRRRQIKPSAAKFRRFIYRTPENPMPELANRCSDSQAPPQNRSKRDKCSSNSRKSQLSVELFGALVRGDL
jgi:hypothetical protein